MKYIGTISLAQWPKPAIKRMVGELDLHEAILGWETGKSGYEHCQFAIDCGRDMEQWNRENRLGWHIEPCISWQDTIDYCRKSGNYTYIGNSVEEPEYRRISDRRPTAIHTDIERHLRMQNDRAITVVVDRRGSTGKSTLGYLHDRRGDWFAIPRLEREQHRANDYIAMHWANEPVIWLDLPRGEVLEEEHAILLEDIKDGLIKSSKYEGTKKYTRGAKVLVTTNNWVPPKTYKALTKDRWDILVLKTEENGELSQGNTDNPPQGD